MTTYVAVRAFVAAGRTVAPGEVVDAGGWPPNRARQLVDLRYLAPAPGATVSGPTTAAAAPARPAAEKEHARGKPRH